ncbi:MAG TPA: chromosome segregation SMC family protein, partial [Pseudorhizobium sp.]|nr:chromosome segregation SMC family protein [Pseudorhizobium sp.]
PELREEEAKAGAALQRIQIARTQLDEEAGRMLKRRDELSRRLLQLAEDIRREEQLVADNANFLAKLGEEEQEINDILLDSGAETEEVREAFEAAAAVLAETEKIFAVLTAQRAEAAASRAQLERQIRELGERRQKLDRQLHEAEAEGQSLAERLSALDDPVERREAVEAAEYALEEAAAAAEDVEAVLVQARSAEVEARRPVEAARARLNGLETEARTINRMLAASEAAGDFPPVAEAISVERGYETALGAALGDDLESSVDPAAPAHWVQNGDPAADPPLPAGSEPLLLRMSAPPELARRLAQIGLVSTAEDARRLMPQLKPGQRLVTHDGAVYRWDGHVASSEAPGAAALRLSQKNRLAELEGEMEEARVILADAEQALSEATARIVAEEAGLADARDRSRIASRQLAEAREQLAGAERAAGDLLRRRDVVTETLNQIRMQIGDLLVQEENARIELEDAPDLTQIDARLRDQQLAVATDRSILAEARARFEGLSRETEARRRRLVAIAQERSAWQARAQNAESHVATLRDREEEAREEIVDLEAAPEEIEEQRRNLLSELSKAEAARKTAADRLVEAETRQREADRIATTALAELAEAREKRGRAEERLVSSAERRHESEQRIREGLGIAPQEILRLAGVTPGSALPEVREIEREVDRLKMERERLGAVNLRAEEEQKELSDKLDALIRERDDIIEAIRKLRGAIQNLNREGRERLLAAFEVVNTEFQRLFTHLFGGGTAELQLIESDDPLEAGLEILARPPGKKPQTMTLLSGGEQALTAMALIFAVFLTNPAPICVLDEVDAPLDDHNVERYCNLMDEMAASTETRFVIITHNPITMARMNRLFGVTMAEQGVSQLVSVDLQTAELLREAS